MRKAILILLTLTTLASCKKQSFDEQVLQDIEDFNQKDAPKRLDPNTTFDSIQYDIHSRTLSYFYTIEGDISLDDLPIEDMQQVLLNNIRSSIQFKAHKEHGVNFHYIYIDGKTGKAFINCTFTPEDYK